ncbi:glycosyltransferase family 2 protein [Vagococcus fluvialis]|uniref:glycosyltransferase family 2 protein n=2 Tax=Vagococcus fluvialis TaxID=2738 RepID=UPI00203455E3|nr:glycosyltransferase family 2 protein [Vagococcus fluvialis]MCM2137979.1 glycosyltransferase family 2 protein [Vagococcus fluvialis]
MRNLLYLVIPCYNEEEVLMETSRQLKIKMNNLIESQKIDSKSKIAFVNDGSKDKTWELIQELCGESQLFEGINLAHNVGHQHALLAGLLTVNNDADMIISLDADLQDDINVIDEMVEEYHNGYEIVYGVRKERTTDTKFKKWTAESFYKLMGKMGVEIVYNHADYRLMSKRAVEELSQYNEVNTFLRGIIPTIGLKNTKVYYDRKERFAGESKYPLKKMLEFAFEGITSFSVKPIRLITMIGAGLISLSFLLMIYSLVRYVQGNIVTGWTSLILSIWLIGGVLMLALGIIGEYVGKIYLEVKQRPRYIVMERINND